MSKITPPPWRSDLSYIYGDIEGKKLVTDVCGHGDNEQDFADAAFIVRACNSHDEMVKALEEISELTTALRQGGPDPMDLQGLSEALEHATNLAHAALTAAGAPKS